MINEVVKTAKTIEEALALGCAELGKKEEEVSYEIMEMPKKGFLGFGNAPAKVRVYYEVSKAKTAAAYLKSILDAMDIKDYKVNLTENDDAIFIVLEGENLGAVIGRRGETLDAIQYLVSLVANRVDNKYTRITIDSGNYREKREKTLQTLAKKIAINAVKTGRSSTLEPMNPYERRIIHAAVSQIEGATSTSVGEEPTRRVVISSQNPKKGGFNKDKRGYKGKKPYNNKPRNFTNDSGEKPKFENKEQVAEENAVPFAKPSQEVASKPLYSKIEL